MKKTFSDNYPKIQRLQGKILFPHNIKEVQIQDDEKTTRRAYEYELIYVEDRGQQIDDYEHFKKANYAELRRACYGSWQEQFDMMYKNTWNQHVAAVKGEFPKQDGLNATQIFVENDNVS